MKTLIKKLKLGILLTGLVMLTSCDSGNKLLSVAGTIAIHPTIPSMAINATKYTGNKIAQYFKISSASKKVNGLTGKKVGKSNNSPGALPISIGVAEGARLVPSPGR